VNFSRPVSVEHEKTLRQRTRIRKLSVMAISLGLVVWLGYLGAQRMI